jgi:hypothetical protein
MKRLLSRSRKIEWPEQPTLRVFSEHTLLLMAFS